MSEIDQFVAVLEALKAATDMMAKDPRTQKDDERWAIFSRCVAAIDPWLKNKDGTNRGTGQSVYNG